MITTKGRYALRVLIDLAEHKDERLVALKDIADRQDISKKYLEIIMRELVSGGFVLGISGKGGGYKLLREPADYIVGEIIEHMEGSLASVACLEHGTGQCPRESFCKTLPMWKEYDELTHNFFFSRTLDDLVKPSQKIL